MGFYGFQTFELDPMESNRIKTQLPQSSMPSTDLPLGHGWPRDGSERVISACSRGVIATEHHRPNASVIMGQKIHVNNQKRPKNEATRKYFKIMTIKDKYLALFSYLKNILLLNQLYV